MSDTSVLLDIDDSGIAAITLNRPQHFNVIAVESMQPFSAAIAQIEQRRDVRAVILRGNGAAFSGGGDLNAMRAHLDDMPSFLAATIDAFHTAILALRRLPMPTIAQVQGSAAGGGFSLALACDFVVAAQNARFVVAYPKLATSTDGGLSYFLTQRLGSARALDILLLRDQIGAQEAFDLGIVTRVAAPEQLETEARAVAARIAQLPAQSAREIKQLVTRLEDDALPNQLAAERAAFLRNCAQQEFCDRVAAFFDKKR